MNDLTNTILIVDDNEDDIYALKRALRKANVTNPLQAVTHGQAALDYLGGAGSYTDRGRFPLPFVVFLDLNTPFRDGLEILAWIQAQPTLSSLTVAVLTGSVEEKDHRRAVSLGARLFLLKPPSQAGLHQLIEATPGPWIISSATTPLKRLGGSAVSSCGSLIQKPESHEQNSPGFLAS